ncbi:MAG: hypothetical protein H0U74_06800 [Bradymonadaceae bacterium]|nr:hypothetical protein [Lujinxingiaceae bacterium]
MGESDKRSGRRSEETLTAIRYQLEWVQENFSIELIVLADAAGLVLTHAGDADHAEMLAACAEQLNDDKEGPMFSVVEESIPGLTHERLFVGPLEIDGIPLYLCAVATPSDEAHAGMARALGGIRRIYRTTSLTAG